MKIKKKDFQKVKLKVGRTIAKNKSTSLAFKSKIVVPKVNEYSSKIEHGDAKILLKNLKTSSRSCKLNTLIKIRDSLGKRLEMNYIDVLTSVIELVTDKEGEVRKAAVRVIAEVLEHSSSNQLASCFPTIRKHIRCTFTHVNEDIRHLSLQLLEKVLNFIPECICNSINILKGFLDLISYYGEGKTRLRTTPDMRVSALEWRIKVLTYLSKVLDANMKILKSENKAIPDVVMLEDDKSLGLHCVNVHCYNSFKSENLLSFSLYGSVEADDSFTNANSVECFLPDIMSVLFDIWMEVVPPEALENMSEDTAKAMILVLQILSLLQEWVNYVDSKNPHLGIFGTWKNNNSNYIQMNLYSRFPFMIDIAEAMNQNKSEDNSTDLWCEVNLRLCDIYSMIVLGVAEVNNELHERVSSYLLQVIETLHYEDSSLEMVLKIMRCFLNNSEKHIIYQEHLMILYDVVQNILEYNLKKQTIISFFLDLVLNSDIDVTVIPAINLFLKSLPSEFLKLLEHDLNTDFLQNVKKVAGRGFEPFQEGLSKCIDDVIAFLPSSSPAYQHTIAHFIATMHTITPPVFMKLSVALREHTIDKYIMRYIFQNLCRKCTMEDDGIKAEYFIAFLLNTAVGVAPSEEDYWINKREIFYPFIQLIPFELSPIKIVPNKEWVKHKDILNAAMYALDNLPGRRSISMCIENFILMYLNRMSNIPIHSAVSLLKLQQKFITSYQVQRNQELLMDLCNITLGLLLYDCALNEVFGEDDEAVEYTVCDFLLEEVENKSCIFSIIRRNIENISSFEAGECAYSIIQQLLSTGSTTPDDIEKGHSVANTIKSLISAKGWDQ